MTSIKILAGDLGGTKTNLAVFSTEKGLDIPLAEATFHSRDYDSLESIVQGFLAGCGERVDAAFLGVAGPVVDGRAKITNLDWQLTEKRIKEQCTLARVVLMNDLVATANGIPYLQDDDLFTINAGIPVAGGAMAVVAPGTGLGEAFLVKAGNHYRAFPSEGGHVDFAPATGIEMELLAFMQQRLGHVSYEQVCSGMGLPNIYDFYKQRGAAPEEARIAEQLAAADDSTPVIVNGALAATAPCALCQAALKTFVAVLGAEAGNLALKVLATGGVYLGGGIPPRILEFLGKDNIFMDAFVSKGRMSELLAAIPVRVITNPRAALLGAAAYGLQPEFDDG
jgi:glucokinase